MDTGPNSSIVQELQRLHQQLRISALSLSGYIAVTFEKKDAETTSAEDIPEYIISAIESARRAFKSSTLQSQLYALPDTRDLLTYRNDVIASSKEYCIELYKAIVAVQNAINTRIEGDQLSDNEGKTPAPQANTAPSLSQSQRTPISAPSRVSVRKMMQDNAVLKANVRNLANAASYLPLDPTSGSTQQTLDTVLDILGENAYEIQNALKEDPAFADTFKAQFLEEAYTFRAETAKETGGKVLILSGLDRGQTREVLTTLSARTSETGPQGVRAFFANTRVENRKHLSEVSGREEQFLSKNEVREVLKLQGQGLPLSPEQEKILAQYGQLSKEKESYQWAIEQQDELEREDRPRDLSTRARNYLASQNRATSSSVDTVAPGYEIFEVYELPEEISPEIYEVLLSGGEVSDSDIMGDGDYDDDFYYSGGSDESVTSGMEGESASGGRRRTPRLLRGKKKTDGPVDEAKEAAEKAAKAAKKAEKAKKNTERLAKLKNASTAMRAALTNPVVLAGLGAGAGAVSTLIGIAQASAPLIIGGSTAAGAGIGFLIGGPVGALIGGGVGFVVGGLTNSAVQSAIPSGLSSAVEGLKTAGQTANTLGQLGQSGLAQVAKGTPEGISALSKGTASALQSGQALAGKLASTAVSGLNTGTAIATSAGGPWWATTALGMNTTVGGLVIGVGAGTVVIQTVLLSTFLIKSTVTETSKYAEVTKTVAPKATFGNEELPVQVTYTVTIKAKGEYKVTVHSLKDEVSITSASGTPPTVDLNSALLAGAGTLPFTLSGGESKTITYSATYEGEDFIDSRIVNTVTAKITANDPEAGKEVDEEVVGSAIVTIGNPPENLACIRLVEGGKSIRLLAGDTVTTVNWSPEDESHIIQAFSVMNNYPRFIQLLCGADGSRTVNIFRVARNQYFNGAEYSGERIADGIALFNLSFRLSWMDMRRTLVHELSHYIDGNNDKMRNPFTNAVGKEGNDPSGRMCTYPLGYADYPSVDRKNSEDFAESVAQYFVFEDKESKRCQILHDMDTIYPKRYDWVRQNVAGGLAQPDDPSQP